MSDFQLIYDHCAKLLHFMERDPWKTYHATTLIHQWLAAGCDAQADVIPTITALWKKSPTRPTSLTYFNRAVLEAREKRVGSIEHVQRAAEAKAEAIRFRMKINKFVPRYDREWLATRESQQEGKHVE